MKSNIDHLNESTDRRGWRWLRRVLITLSTIVTLAVAFYTVENWRGKRAWEECKRDAENHGLPVSWESYIPKPVPDEQNFFKAPGIDQRNWVGRGSTELAARFSSAWPQITNGLLLATIRVVDPRTIAETQDRSLLIFDNPTVRDESERQLRNIIGPSLPSAHMPQLITLKQESEIKAGMLILGAQGARSEKEVAACFPNHIDGCVLEIQKTADSSLFEVRLRFTPIAAADLLTSTEALKPEFEIIREAAKRPFARMEGDYRDAVNVPIPNFMLFRTIAQVVAGRARANLLLGNTSHAVSDLSLLGDICRVLESRPEHKPMTLLAAMIKVAIAGLYIETVTEGLTSRSWNEADITTLQGQVSAFDLMRHVNYALRTEPIAAASALESIPADTLAGLLFFSPPTPSFREQLKEPRYLLVKWMPRGWRYQNMANAIKRAERNLPHLSTKTVDPTQVARMNEEAQSVGRNHSPYTFLSEMFFPNLFKTVQTTAYRETQFRQTMLALAMERYRLVRGEYPRSLAQLVPDCIKELPSDIIGGGEMIFRRLEGGAFVIYSVGWNEVDESGQGVFDPSGRSQLSEGDWVWKMPPLEIPQKATKEAKE